MKEKIKGILNNKRVLSYIAIIFMAIFICIPLFSRYMEIARDDGIQHICRLIGVIDSVHENKIFPVIMSKFCNGFGYSWNIFYSPITAYTPLIFRIFTSSVVVMLKLFMFSTIVLSGIFMYKLVFQISKSHKASVIAAIIYMSAPYHLTDLYNRIAIAELASFIFLPILFRGMYCLLYDNQEKVYNIAIGAVGLILSHNVIAFYSAIFCMLYLLINFKKLKNKNIIKAIAINAVIILLITSFYTLPLLEHHNATTYEVFVNGRMYSDEIINRSKLVLSDLFTTEPYNMNFHIGIPIIFGLILTIFYITKIDRRYKSTIIIFLIFGIISLFMTLKIFPFEHLPGVLKMLQFPWRMIEFQILFLGVVSGVSIAMLINKNSKSELFVIIGIMICVSYITITSAKQTKQIFNEEDYKPAIPVTSEYTRIHPGLASFEYLPTKAFKNRTYLENRSQDVIVLKGNAEISNQTKDGTNLKFKIKNTNEDTIIELPYIFYLGYNAQINNEDGTSQSLNIEESDNGFCMIEIKNVVDGEIKVSYSGTPLMKVSYILSILGIVCMIVYIKIIKRVDFKNS